MKVIIGIENLLACSMSLRALRYPPGAAIPKLRATLSLVSRPF